MEQSAVTKAAQFFLLVSTQTTRLSLGRASTILPRSSGKPKAWLVESIRKGWDGVVSKNFLRQVSECELDGMRQRWKFWRKRFAQKLNSDDLPERMKFSRCFPDGMDTWSVSECECSMSATHTSCDWNLKSPLLTVCSILDLFYKVDHYFWWQCGFLIQPGIEKLWKQIRIKRENFIYLGHPHQPGFRKASW